eukprot:gnl/MRDRNA2_/MRDRNA2_17097_c0_seq1.p1 gnl/MRDRNA2_/MRDRNA2_17097_c0~~gnl/MRDRNA2_/MRDRNA2_17097_c0_seq1.p1  ORF type:complete len:405 (+),score=48.69 gnl/MRDRNA2_/MRDRNA2_17097_c0_seq1:127-1215(+)
MTSPRPERVLHMQVEAVKGLKESGTKSTVSVTVQVGSDVMTTPTVEASEDVVWSNPCTMKFFVYNPHQLVSIHAYDEYFQWWGNTLMGVDHEACEIGFVDHLTVADLCNQVAQDESDDLDRVWLPFRSRYLNQQNCGCLCVAVDVLKPCPVDHSEAVGTCRLLSVRMLGMRGTRDVELITSVTAFVHVEEVTKSTRKSMLYQKGNETKKLKERDSDDRLAVLVDRLHREKKLPVTEISKLLDEDEEFVTEIIDGHCSLGAVWHEALHFEINAEPAIPVIGVTLKRSDGVEYGRREVFAVQVDEPILVAFDQGIIAEVEFQICGLRRKRNIEHHAGQTKRCSPSVHASPAEKIHVEWGTSSPR